MIAPLAALVPVDRWLFLKINREWTCASLDAVMPVVTDLHKLAWFRWGAAPAAAGLWLWRGGRRALQVLVVAAVAIGVGDLVAYRVVKPWAARLRPEYSLAGAVKRAPTGGLYGFPSNHAVNAAAAASVLSIAYPAGALAFAAIAGLIGYSRIYVGAHYPLDVLAGFVLGAGIGLPWAWLMLGRGGGASGKKKKRR
jgi:undecaprenyl-diphosphatase